MGRVLPGAFDVGLCILESVVIAKQCRKGNVGAKQRFVPVERGCDFENHSVMGDSFLYFAFGFIYRAKSPVR